MSDLNSPASPTEEEQKVPNETKTKGESEKQARKDEKKRRQEEREAAAKAAARAHIVYLTWEELKAGSKPYGHLPVLKSNKQTFECIPDVSEYTHLKDLNKSLVGKEVKIRARVGSTRAAGKGAFIVLRQEFATAQATLWADEKISKEMVKYAGKMTKESVVDVYAIVQAVQEEIKSATQKDVELLVQRLYTVSEAVAPLPLLVEDAGRPEPVPGSEAATSFVPVGQEVRLDNRVLDTRAPAHIAIFRIQSAVGQFFREFLYTQGFSEIHTPKLIGTASEGGADVFEVKYFSGKAYLAQSPQLYKQMAVMADLMRVFEIGPVFRAENSNTHRHLTEFVGLDIEMAFHKHYHEVLDVIDAMFVFIFEKIKEKFSRELQAIQDQYPFEPIKYKVGERNLRLTYKEALELLKEDGMDIADEMYDIGTEDEKRLGRIIKKKYDTDFYVVDKFPFKYRPFYTMEDPEDPKWANAYDVFLRGEEVSSGSQRIHDAEMLADRAAKKGVPAHTIQSYVDSFKYGSYPHGGCGIGLERVVMLYLGIGNVRKTSFLPRDPKRLTP